jgi:hypothetical protein
LIEFAPYLGDDPESRLKAAGFVPLPREAGCG